MTPRSNPIDTERRHVDARIAAGHEGGDQGAGAGAVAQAGMAVAKGEVGVAVVRRAGDHRL